MELLTTKELCDRLKISRSTLDRLREAGTLTTPQHYLDVRLATSKKASYRWKVEAIEQLFSKPARKRAK